MLPIAERLWAGVLFVINAITLSPIPNASPASQIVFQTSSPKNGPIFYPPGGDSNDKFKCNYTNMIGYKPCSTSLDRKCWLRRDSDGHQFDIWTDYENEMPIGIERKYELLLEADDYDADGLNFPWAKLFNKQYPGPWIQACWGDTITINVNNNLRFNGTSVHWHGIRQLRSMQMDGVNGITQCPIAPGDYFQYKFNVTQYGSSWYHSHYSVQYADGAVGPMTIHGPSSDEWDETINPPLIMTDWGHNSAFEAVATHQLLNRDILLNGRGNVTRYNNSITNETTIQDPYSITFERPRIGQAVKKYLLSIINTSFETTFVFSIDNHNLTVISADFVPILPYKASSILVGIGQRYNVIVEANPVVGYNGSSPLPDDWNFWIRTQESDCFRQKPGSDGYEKTGILRYNNSIQTMPSSQIWSDIPTNCSDEDYSNLHPILEWDVPKIPANGNSKYHKTGEEFSISLNGPPNPPYPYPLARWTLGPDEPFSPIRVNYLSPTFLRLNDSNWDSLERIVPENYSDKSWVFLVIQGTANVGAHPVAQSNTTYSPENATLKYDNPPRRDVVLVPANGYVVMAFKTDNPGAWLVHCHIAFHISEGLGMQIMERQGAADEIWPHTGTSEGAEAVREAERVCKNWKDWYDTSSNWIPTSQQEDCKDDPAMCFMNDSGV